MGSPMITMTVNGRFTHIRENDFKLGHILLPLSPDLPYMSAEGIMSAVEEGCAMLREMGMGNRAAAAEKAMARYRLNEADHATLNTWAFNSILAADGLGMGQDFGTCNKRSDYKA